MASAKQPWGGFDDDGDSFYDMDDIYDPSQDDDEAECVAAWEDADGQWEIYEEYAAQFDDDPNPYDGT